MELTFEEVKEYLSRMAVYMKHLYDSGDKEGSLKIANFLLKVLVKIGDKHLQKMSYISLLISVFILDFLSSTLKLRDYYSFNKLLEIIAQIDINSKLISLIFYSSSIPENEEEKDYERKRIFILSEFYEEMLLLDYKYFSKFFYFLLYYTYKNKEFAKQYLIPLLIDFYRKNRNSLSKTEVEEFLKGILSDILRTIKGKNYTLKEDFILELGKESIYNLWLEDFKYIIEYIRLYPSLLPSYKDKNGELTFNRMLTIWGIYIFYLLIEDEKLFPLEKKRELLEEITQLKIDITYGLSEDFSQALKYSIRQIWGISNQEKVKSLEEIIEEYENSILNKWELFPSKGGVKKLKMKQAIRFFFLFGLIDAILLGLYYVENIMNNTNDNYYILELISIIDLREPLGIYREVVEGFRKHLKLVGLKIEEPKLSNIYFSSEKELSKLEKLKRFKKALNHLLKLSLKRFLELKLNELINYLNNEDISAKLEEWKQSCKEVVTSWKSSLIVEDNILLSDLSLNIIGLPPKEECLGINIHNLQINQCRDFFLKRAGNIRLLLGRYETLNDIYKPILEELLNELLSQETEFKKKFEEWCRKEKLLILYFPLHSFF